MTATRPAEPVATPSPPGPTAPPALGLTGCRRADAPILMA
jgi:hypothetical protein